MSATTRLRMIPKVVPPDFCRADLNSGACDATVKPRHEVSGSAATAARRAGRCYLTAHLPPTVEIGSEMKRQREELTEHTEREAWARLPACPQESLRTRTSPLVSEAA
jgi:hypothetical protein